MLYQRRTFTVPAGAGNGAMCKGKGHSAIDSRGRCVCCGEKLEPPLAVPASDQASEQAAVASSSSNVELVGGPLDGLTLPRDRFTYIAGAQHYVLEHGSQRLYFKRAPLYGREEAERFVFDGFHPGTP